MADHVRKFYDDYALLQAERGINRRHHRIMEWLRFFGLRDGMDLLPHQTRHSLYLAGGQELGGRFELDGELRYAHRTSDSASLASTATNAKTG